ncbi:hypothetical protein TNCV_1936171 [Trichonephila clavipes]|nr:hypothetical protein TNCV_1936171 [Trichonephila clavipes]
MSKALVDHTFVRLEPQIQDYEEWIEDYLDFDRKELAIPDSQVDKVVTTIEEGNVDIDKIGRKSETGVAGFI